MSVRILHVVGDSNLGGASFGILRLARFWKSLGWEVDILATDARFLRTARAEGVSTIELDVIWRKIRPLRDLVGLFHLYRFLKRTNYTVVHTHTSKAGFIGRIAAGLAGIPVVLHTAHGFAFHEESPWYQIAFYTVLERLASLGCHRVVTVSRFHESWAKRLRIAAPRKILAIPNGIPDPLSSKPSHEPSDEPGDERRYAANDPAAVRRKWCVYPGQTVILTPGRLAEGKGLEDLLEAMALLKPDWGDRLVLRIAGEGHLRPRLEALVKDRSLTGHVQFLGFQSGIPGLLAAADLVVLATWREGLSIVLLEAMAQGKAIVTTSIGSNREATRDGEGALLVPPARPRELACAIHRMASDRPLMRKYGTAARAIYERQYTQQSMLAGYHNLYLQLLKEQERAHSVSSLLSSLHR